MKQKTFNAVVGTLFGIIAFLHALRIYRHWNASVGGWIVPVWLSWLALVLAGYLACAAFRLMKQR